MKRFALALLMSTTACASQLATLPPTDSYVMTEGESPRLSNNEQKLFEAINKELVRLGLPTATLGSYEQNVATIMANAALARIWRGSGRAIAEENTMQIAPPVSGQQGSPQAKHEVASGRLASLTDEEDDTDIKHLHTPQHLTASGIPQNVRVHIFGATFAETTLSDDEIKDFVRAIRPRHLYADLKLGAVVLPVGDADKRIFVVALRDRVFDLTKGPPRFGTPGATFDVAGTAFERGLKSIKLALLGPDGKVLLGRAPIDAQGNFSTTMTLPNAPGLYVFDAARSVDSENAVHVPIFAGVPEIPWPASADPNEAPVDGTRSVSQKLANAIAEWRHSHGLSAAQIDTGLSAFSKAEATLRATAEDAATGEGSGTPQARLDQGWRDRLKAAGYDSSSVHGFWSIQNDDYINDFFARFPGTAFDAAYVSSPSVQKFGIGVVLVPHDVDKDSTSVRYAIQWTMQDPTPPTWEPPHPTAGSITRQLTVAIRADGTMSVDGAQVDEARLKQAIDTARSVNPDLEVILQVEEGAKPEVVQHVTEVIKAEGVLSIISHPPTPPAPAPQTSAPSP